MSLRRRDLDPRRFVPDDAWLTEAGRRDVVAVDVAVAPAEARERVWAEIAGVPGRPVEEGIVAVGGAALVRRPDGFRIVSGGEDGLDSLEWVAELVVNALVDQPHARLEWHPVPPDEARPLDRWPRGRPTCGPPAT